MRLRAWLSLQGRRWNRSRFWRGRRHRLFGHQLEQLEDRTLLSGVTLYEQSAIAFGFGGGPDMLATAFVSNQDETQPDVDNSIAYDNFTLVSDMIVQGVQWTGGYNGLFNNNSSFRGDIDFLVDFFPHDDVGDKPNTAAGIRSFVLNSGSSGNDDGTDVTTTQNPLETLRNGGRVFDYSSSLTPFMLPAGEYWLSIVARQTFPSPDPITESTNSDAFFDPEWGWRLGMGGDGNAWQFFALEDPAVPGSQFNTDFAFSIIGVPEPGGCILLLAGLSCFAARKPRRD